MDQSRTRRWRPAWPCPVPAVLAAQRHGAADPTQITAGDGSVWRGIRTPEGSATLRVHRLAADGTIRGEAWGEGADWALAQLPALLGADDDVSGFVPQHPVVAAAQRAHPHVRFGRSGVVLDALVPAVIEQKVTGQEAFAGFAALVRRFGERAPGPGPGGRRTLMVQPAPARLAAIASWEWLALHVDPARSRTLVGAARVAGSLERFASASGPELDAALRSLPGIGVWTAAEVRQRVLGDPDAVSFGDYHVAQDVGWALTGAPVDDAGLARLLEPWPGHRGRVVALVRSHAGHRPRRGPRMAPRTHLPRR